MARPKRVNYATGAAGQERFKKALQAYLKKTKAAKDKANKITSTQENIKKQKAASKKSTTTKVRELTKSKASSTAKKSTAKTKPSGKVTLREAIEAKAKQTTKKTVAKKPVAKKPVAKKPVAKKPVAKKPVAKKPAGKVPAKKPLLSNKQKLQIKKGVKTATNTTKKVVKSGVEKGKKLASNVKKKVGATKKALNKPSPTKRPTTRLQKLASKANKGLQKAGKYAKGPLAKNVSSKLKAIGKGIAKDPKSVLKGAKGAGASILAERLSTAVTNRAAKTVFGKERLEKGKAKLADVRKNPDKYERTALGYRLKGTGPKKDKPTTNKKVTSNKNNKKLKVNKKDDRSPTQTNPNNKTKVTSKPKKMHAIEKRNRKIFGDAHVDKLKAKHAAFKARRKKKKTLFR